MLYVPDENVMIKTCSFMVHQIFFVNVAFKEGGPTMRPKDLWHDLLPAIVYIIGCISPMSCLVGTWFSLTTATHSIPS